MKKIITSILEYAKMFDRENLCVLGDSIAVRDNDTMFVTDKDCLIADLTAENIKEVKIDSESNIFSQIFLAREDIKVIVHAHPKNICAVSNKGKTIPAVLDDMAQIVGVNAKCAKNNTESIIKTMKGRNSILVKNDGAICTGRTLNETYACCLILEKSARAFIGGSILGGCKVINPFEARLMRFVYKVKYSKKNQENLAQEEN